MGGNLMYPTPQPVNSMMMSAPSHENKVVSNDFNKAPDVQMRSMEDDSEFPTLRN